VDDALRRVLVREIEREVGAAGVPEGDVIKYFEEHANDYQQPERVRISRILVDDKALAKKILGEARSKDGPSSWNRLARDHSVDTSTRLRGGQLGFVGPDGHTDIPQLEVSPTLYAAVARVKDGEFVPEPVEEGARFAIVWRRGTLRAVSRTLVEERDAIRGVLVQERVGARLRELVARLTQAHVRHVEDSPLEHLAMPATGEIRPAPRASPPQAAPVPSADPAPRPTERGLR
jgi:peptidyl-prolyl cis-trans isomerase C